MWSEGSHQKPIKWELGFVFVHEESEDREREREREVQRVSKGVSSVHAEDPSTPHTNQRLRLHLSTQRLTSKIPTC